GPSLADLQGPLQHPAMVLETIPGQAGAVIELDFHRLAKEIDQRARQQRVFQGDLAAGAGTDDVDRTRILPQLFADGAVIDETGYQAASRLGGPEECLRAV